MYLKSLTLKGFKSFADKSTLKLLPGITAIVGPNGSGKSNISDAVLWVLGERNAKNLRGQAMEDVIFAGSSARHSTSMAEVELVLDNSDGTLPVDFEEVSIARRMYRNGESEYLINGSLARRMDVMDILHDTGLGTGTHSIISQGSIDSILQSKPEDRRNLVEEAAGILKHKQRMEKSARKLERMRAHADRVSDIAGEVERQLGPLARKAKRAKRYEELIGQLKDAKLSLAVDDLRKLQVRHDQILAEEKTATDELSKHRELIRNVDAQIEELQERIRREGVDAGEVAKRQTAAQTASERISSLAALARDRRRGSLDRASELELSLETISEEMSRNVAASMESRTNLEEISENERSLGEACERLAKRKGELSEKGSALEGRIASLDSQIKDMEAKIRDLRVVHAHAHEDLANGMARAKVLDAHASELESAKIKAQADFDDAKARTDAIASSLESMEAEEERARELVATCMRAREAARKASDEADADLNSLQAQINALDELEKKSLGGSGSASQWFSQNSKSLSIDSTPLSYVVSAKPEVENLVESLLGEFANAFVVDSAKAAARISKLIDESGTKGRLPIVAADASHARQNPDDIIARSDGCIPLIEFLDCPDEDRRMVEALFGNVIVCDDFELALKLSAEDEAGHVFATRDCKIVWPSGKMAFGTSDGQGVGSFERSRHLKELKSSLGDARSACEAARESATSAEESLRDAQNQSLDVAERLAALKGSAASAQEACLAAKAKLESASSELDRSNADRDEAVNAVTIAKPKIEDAARSLAELEDRLKEDAAERSALSLDLAPIQEELAQVSADLSERKLEHAKAMERATYLDLATKRLADDAARLKQRLEDAKAQSARKRAAAGRIAEIEGMLESLSTILGKWASRLQDESAMATSATSSLHSKMNELRNASRSAQATYDEANEKLSSVRIEKARAEMQVQSAVQVIVDDCDMPLEIALEEPRLEDRQDVEQVAFELDRKIANLGTINLDAAQEYDELKVRHDYLQSQLEDLRSATRSLWRIDHMIENKMRDAFMRTFELVQKNFQEIFSDLFPGGSAELKLTDPEDIENSGVEVNAQPAGKRISKMSLMSGGEKSLTALALLFALYKTRPTPFYILDEVEAALDDSNLRRLVNYIDALRNDTQLIMITHQRRTMEMSDVLFGVSMQADGVTKVISQKLERALETAQ